MKKYMDFLITHTFKKDILVNGDYSHRQDVTNTVTQLIDAEEKSFYDIDKVLNVIAYEYKQFVSRKKDDNDYSFDLFITVGIHNKCTMFRLSYRKTWEKFHRYQRNNMDHKQIDTIDETPKTVKEVLDLVKYNLNSLFAYAVSYDKE